MPINRERVSPLPEDFKLWGRRMQDAHDFWGALIGIIAASGFIGFVLGWLVR